MSSEHVSVRLERHGAAFFTLSIASLASFAIGRMRIRYGWVLSNAALLTYVFRPRSSRSRSTASRASTG